MLATPRSTVAEHRCSVLDERQHVESLSGKGLAVATGQVMSNGAGTM